MSGFAGFAAGFVVGPVTVEVPATSANLGPGFDSLGLALDLHDTLVDEVTGSGLELELEGEGADRLPHDERHLVVRTMRRAFAALGGQPPGLRLRFTNRIPQSRGLGSSSAAIVGGLALARALVPGGERLGDDALLRMANELEGHPDNVAPALFGGLVVAGQDGADVWAVPARLDPSVEVVVFVPPDGVSTEAARGLLPDTVAHADAAANAGRAALLIAALGGQTGQLLRATEDFLHQSYRSSAMPDSYDLVLRLRAEGIPAIISGAGPTVLAFTTTGPGELPARSPEGWCPQGWQVRPLRVDHRGVRVV